MGIVGMDMAFPKAYENKKANPGSLKLMGMLAFLEYNAVRCCRWWVKKD